MINYEKIKLGKGLTKNQKRLREVYLKHQLNLDSENFATKTILLGHNVRIIEDLDLHVECTRGISGTFFVYDDKQKENIKIHVSTQSIKNWKWNYTKYLDDVYIILGRKNIVRHRREPNCYSYNDDCYKLYDNNNILRKIEPEVNHRKKEGGISLYKEEFKGGV